MTPVLGNLMLILSIICKEPKQTLIISFIWGLSLMPCVRCSHPAMSLWEECELRRAERKTGLHFFAAQRPCPSSGVRCTFWGSSGSQSSSQARSVLNELNTNTCRWFYCNILKCKNLNSSVLSHFMRIVNPRVPHVGRFTQILGYIPSKYFKCVVNQNIKRKTQIMALHESINYLFMPFKVLHSLGPLASAVVVPKQHQGAWELRLGASREKWAWNINACVGVRWAQSWGVLAPQSSRLVWYACGLRTWTCLSPG